MPAFMKGELLISLLAVSKRFSVRPSEIAGVSDQYAAWCLDEACMYLMCRIEQEGTLPPGLAAGTCGETAEALGGMKGVKVIDKRRNGGGVPDADHRRIP